MRSTLLALALLLVFLVSACGTTPLVADLPMPSTLWGQTTVTVQNVGVEDLEIVNPLLEVRYSNTGEGAGSIQSEILEVAGKNAKTLKFSWGEYLTNGELTSAMVFAPDGNPIEARITLRVPEMSLIHLFVAPRSTVDRSRLVLQYTYKDGAFVMKDATYMEEWGFSNNGMMTYGLQAWWKNASELFPEYSDWGFWENGTNAFSQVTAALEEARTVLSSTGPSWMVIDEDGPREVIGRQSGMKLYRNGVFAGDIVFTYQNLWGVMPNTPAIGKGALSRVEWKMADGTYRALSILAAQLSPRPTAIYIYSKTSAQADYVETTNWVPLYGKLNKHSQEVKDVLFAIYSAGGIGKLTSTVTTSEGSGTAEIGDGGGVFYGFFGKPRLADVMELRNFLDLTGLPGVKALGFYYPTSQASGNGIHYFLSTSALTLVSPEKVLETYGVDVGLLDRVGFPILD